MRHIKTTHVIFSVISTLILAISIAGQALAAGSATLTLDPGSGSLAVGRDFTVAVRANTGSVAVNAIEVGLSYNSSLVNLVRSEFPSSYGYKRDDSKTGLACVTVATMGTTISGDNVVAYLTFHTNNPGTLSFNYVTTQNACYNGSPGTSILNTSQFNVWNGNTTAGTFTIVGSGTTPTPTPISTPKPPTNTTTTPKPTASTGSSTTTGNTNNNSTSSPSANNTSSTQPAVQGESSTGYMVAVKVVDANNKIVVGAKVTINGITAVTDTSGVASFSNISVGKHDAIVEYSGKKFNKMIEVKGVSTSKPQSFSLKAGASGTDYTQYAIVAAAIIIGLVLIYILIKKINKPRDHHMDGAPIIGGPTGPSDTITPGMQGPTNIGSVVGPNQVNQTVINNNESQGTNNGKL